RQPAGDEGSFIARDIGAALRLVRGVPVAARQAVEQGKGHEESATQFVFLRDLGSSWIMTRPPQASSLASPVFMATLSWQPTKTFSPSESTTLSPLSCSVWLTMLKVPVSAVASCVWDLR